MRVGPILYENVLYYKALKKKVVFRVSVHAYRYNQLHISLQWWVRLHYLTIKMKFRITLSNLIRPLFDEDMQAEIGRQGTMV